MRIVRGCLAWQRDGLNPPQAVRAATLEYRRESEQLQRWIDANCEIRADGRLQAGPAFEDYKRWCERQREKPDLNQKTFGQLMSERYPPDLKNKRNPFYTGIALRVEWVHLRQDTF